MNIYGIFPRKVREKINAYQESTYGEHMVGKNVIFFSLFDR